MNIFIKYFIGATFCFLASFLLVKYYNNGKGNMHSAIKVIALVIAILFFFTGMFLVNLSAEHYWIECLIDVFNNLTCALLGAGLAFVFKNNLLSIKKPHPFNED